MNKITPLTLGIILATSSFAYAEEGFRQHGAHVHGQVEFNMAQDGQELLIEITAPGADVVGFEHSPESDGEKQTLANAVSVLSRADNIFTLSSAAGCKVAHQSVTHTLQHDKHDHEDHHDHDKHDHDQHHESNGHGEFTAEYHYNCTNIPAIKEMETSWFDQFPSTEAIKINILTDTKQAAMALTPGQKTISF